MIVKVGKMNTWLRRAVSRSALVKGGGRHVLAEQVATLGPFNKSPEPDLPPLLTAFVDVDAHVER